LWQTCLLGFVEWPVVVTISVGVGWRETLPWLSMQTLIDANIDWRSLADHERKHRMGWDAGDSTSFDDVRQEKRRRRRRRAKREKSTV